MLTLPEKLERSGTPAVLRHTGAQRQGGLSEVSGLVRCKPGQPEPAPSPSDTAKKLVGISGQHGCRPAQGTEGFLKGRLSGVAQITKELVFADPSNQKARNLCADALEQLGLSGRVRRMAQRLPDGRCRAAQGQPVRSGTHRHGLAPP